MGFLIENGLLKRYTEERGVTEIVIPDSIRIIGADAFNNCENITNIIIPDSVTSVGISAFFRCTSLVGMSIPVHLNVIVRNRAFYGLSDRVKITVRSANEPTPTPPIVTPKVSRTSPPPPTSTPTPQKTKPEPPPPPKKPSRTPKKSEMEMIFLYYKISEDEDAKIYIENCLSEFVKSLIDKQNLDSIMDITEHTQFLTLENIDEFLDYAIEKARNTKNSAFFKIQVMLTNHKVRLFDMAEADNH